MWLLGAFGDLLGAFRGSFQPQLVCGAVICVATAAAVVRLHEDLSGPFLISSFFFFRHKGSSKKPD